MPVLDTERRAASRSALRYRPIETDQALPAPVISRARRARPDVRVITALAAPDEMDLEEEEQVPRRRSGAPALRARTRRRIHPLLFVGLGLVMTVLLWTGITQAMNWGSNELNTLKYGNPRTFQVDAIVGHGDNAFHLSHFLAINLRGVVTIIEFPAGDPSHARVLATTNVLGPNADQAVATLSFIDIHHNSKPDMLIDIAGVQGVLVNDGKTFRLPTPAEQQQILATLQQSGR